jgi:hypothetical protein
MQPRAKERPHAQQSPLHRRKRCGAKRRTRGISQSRNELAMLRIAVSLSHPLSTAPSGHAARNASTDLYALVKSRTKHWVDRAALWPVAHGPWHWATPWATGPPLDHPVRCRPGIVRNSEVCAAPDQRFTVRAEALRAATHAGNEGKAERVKRRSRRRRVPRRTVVPRQPAAARGRGAG